MRIDLAEGSLLPDAVPASKAPRWTLFRMRCAELFGNDEGNEWGVAHYPFGKWRCRHVVRETRRARGREVSGAWRRRPAC
jgi:hypothetical protein